MIAALVVVAYYGYHWLRKHGYIEWALEELGAHVEHLRENLRATFLLRGHLKEIPTEPVLYIAHPHGLFFMAPFFHWAARVTDWPEGLARVRPAVHSIFFKIPGVRELMEAHGAIEATEEEIERTLRSGDSVVLMPGGLQEIGAERLTVVIRKRRGYLRIAQRVGCPIVPVLTFGEAELFRPMAGLDWFHRYCKAWFGLAVPIPSLASFFRWFRLFREPLEPVETWIGPAISKPTQKKVIAALRALFEKGHRSGDTLTII
jgi:1-acyl-sn-glycerol-3-phosphate acyltransferase